MTTKQSRPDSAIQAARDAFHGNLSLDELDALASLVDGAFVLLVRVTGSCRPAALDQVTRNGSPAAELPVKYRRRVFLSAAAAERAARAAVARGETVRVYLAELTPLFRLAGREGGQQ
jgi:hypothetical protein